jgi:prepilin-type N-terminal cleavage/methylation domain-containing protein
MVRKINGFTVIEILIVILILSIAAAIIIGPIQEKIRAHNLENDVKKIYGLLQEGRMIAFSQKKELTFELSSGSACLKDASNNNVACVSLSYPFSMNTTSLTITDRGTFDPNGGAGATIYYTGDIRSPTVNCMKIYTTRVRMGVWNGSDCILK